MRILVDRHHADLLYSIQRLFEDRLGIAVYVPVGREWWDEGYWRFGEGYGDDRLVNQFLALNDGWKHAAEGLYWTTDESAHPGRRIWGVTLGEFRRMRWTFIMPSVPDNLPGYRRLAEETSAQLLYHVGNTGQWVDWSYDPLVISTSHAAKRNDRTVVVHQEIDSDNGAFAFCDPMYANRHQVRSALNNFHLLPGYGQFLQAEQRLTSLDWEFHLHGHSARDGFLAPCDTLGDAMASAGWGWHDKPVGDGFGHVVHAWAAVGRPLIGNALYYRGTMAEPFWQDRETCLDLGARSLEDTLALMVEIASDGKRHAAMCRAIRRAFDEQVDYKAEAAAVAEFLGVVPALPCTHE